MTQKDIEKLDRHKELFIQPLTRAQAQQRIYKLKQKIREEQALEDNARLQDHTAFVAAKF